MNAFTDQQHAKNLLAIKLAEAGEAWTLLMFGSQLISKNKWEVSEREALSVYLAKKYGWTIEHCQALSYENLALALKEEMAGWKLPKHLTRVCAPLREAIEKLHEPQASRFQ